MILDQLQQDLVAASAREYAPRRRVPAVLMPVAVAAVALVAAVLVQRGTPEREVSVPPAQRTTMDIPGVRSPVAFHVWTNGDGWLCQSVSRSAKVHGCQAGDVLGVTLAAGPPVAYGVSRHGPRRWAVTGVVGPTVDRLEIRARDGTVARARISDVVLEVPVRIDPKRLTAKGRKIARRFPDRLRVRPYVASLRLAAPPHELQIAATIGHQTSFERIPPNVIPGAFRPRQERHLSLLARPAGPQDAPAAEELRRAGDPPGVADTARVALRHRGRMIYAYLGDDGDICLVGFGTGCTTARSAVSDDPLVGGTQSVDGSVQAAGLIHDGPTSVTVERADGTRRKVPVVNNVFVVEDEDVVRLHWEGLEGPVSMPFGG